jgi:hypothetical protein
MTTTKTDDIMNPPRRIEDFRTDLDAEAIDHAMTAQVRAVAAQAYLHAVPTFLHFRQLTEFIQGRRYYEPDACPLGGWVLMRELADPKTTTVSPNVDTLYGATYVLLDRHGPVVLTVPPIADRYWSVALMDAWFDNFSIVGCRSVGGDGATVLIVPPGWDGEVPDGITSVVRAPTPSVCMVQRIYARDRTEDSLLHDLQDRIVVAPLTSWTHGETTFPELDLSDLDLPDVRATTDPLRFFTLTGAYQRSNRPPERDAALVDLFASVGLGPDGDLPTAPTRRQAITDGAADAQRAIDATLSSLPTAGGWRLPDPHAGRAAGGSILERAAIQLTQMGLLPLDEAVYFFAYADAAGAALHGDRDVVLRFAPGERPPHRALGFWSITMYNEQSLLVDNEIDRYVIRPDTPGLTDDHDGGLTLHISHRRPDGVPAGNWLPAPEGPFTLALRVYLGEPPVLDGRWLPPALRAATG